jgi:hypothetical protein
MKKMSATANEHEMAITEILEALDSGEPEAARSWASRVGFDEVVDAIDEGYLEAVRDWASNQLLKIEIDKVTPDLRALVEAGAAMSIYKDRKAKA